MASGDRSVVTMQPEDKLTRMTVGQLQALIESKVATQLQGPLVAVRFAFGLSLVALAVALIALTVAIVR